MTFGTVGVDQALDGLRSGRPVILPTDTVYGLCANPYGERWVRQAYALKGREPIQPSALLASDVDMLLECLPELGSHVGAVLRELLPGPFTFVVPNPARRFRWLAGTNPDAIGVRVPQLPAPADEVVARIGAVMATSANLPGGPDPASVDEIPRELLDGCAAVVDVGGLPGTPSTVIDLTAEAPRILREGAVSADEALARVAGLAGQ